MKTDFAMPINYKGELNSRQMEIIQSCEGPSLIVAGAGTGKTRMLVYKVCYLIDRGVPMSAIMLVTFTNKAAKEMIKRVEQLLGFHPKQLWAGTFHHIANNLLRRYGDLIGLNTGYTIIDSEDSSSIIKDIISGYSTVPDSFPRPAKIKSIISLAVNTGRDLEDIINTGFPHYASFLERIEDINKKYENKKREQNFFDYDDLLIYWHRLLQTMKNDKKVAGLFDYILVDEYHDTNVIQGNILKLLAGESQNITVVGDDAQSIYSFRGATVKNILNFPETYKKAKVFYMNDNYRSTPQIIGLANNIIAHNKEQFPKKLASMRKSGIKPLVVRCYDRKSEASFIAQRVAQLLNSGVAPSDIGILFRSRYQAADIEMELNKFKVPYIMRGGLRFFEQAHTKDILAYLKVTVNFKDSIAWKRLFSMTEGIGSKTAAKITGLVDTLDGLSSLRQNLNGLNRKALNNLSALLDLLERVELCSSVPGSIEIILDAYSSYLQKRYDNERDRLEDIESLKEIASSYDDMSSFLAEATLQENYRGENVPGSAPIMLSTVHQAKGLEWKIVFIVGVAANHFPHQYSENDIRSLEEERRIFYVGVTRAREDLYITYYTRDFYRTFPGEISPFIEEMHPDLFEAWSFD